MAPRSGYAPESLDQPWDKKIADYCSALNEILWEMDRTREAFEVCCEIIRRAAADGGLPLIRDSAKVRDMTERIRTLAASENPAKAS